VAGEEISCRSGEENKIQDVARQNRRIKIKFIQLKMGFNPSNSEWADFAAHTFALLLM
jgi:hypothetical protein